jgi:hypothetical protein
VGVEGHGDYMEMSREYWAQAERGQRFLRMRVGDGGEGAQALWLPVALTSSCREGGGGVGHPPRGPTAMAGRSGGK